MLSTRTQQGQLITQAATNGFLAQALGSVMAMAINVLSENTNTANHANRLALARAVIGSPQGITTWMMPGYLQSTNISGAAGTPANIADGDVDAQTILIWNFYANAYAAQTNSGMPPQFGS